MDPNATELLYVNSSRYYVADNCYESKPNLYDYIDTVYNESKHTIDWFGCFPSCDICWTGTNNEHYRQFNLIVMGILLPILGFFGLMGNSISAFVYSRPECRNSTNLYLCALACSDNAIIITAIFTYTIVIYRSYSEMINIAWTSCSAVLYPMSHVAQICSVYFTVMAGADCLAQIVLSPRLKEIVTSTCVVKRTVLIIVLASILYNIPHCFESAIVECHNTNFNKVTFDFCPASLRFNEEYRRIYYEILYTYFVAVGPLVVLIAMNAFIVTTALLKPSSGSLGDSISLVLVVLLFIACNSAALLLNLFEEKFINQEELQVWFDYLVDVSNVMVVFNSSFNFIIYITFSVPFRRTFKYYMFGGREPLRMKEIPSTNGSLPSNGCVSNGSSNGGANGSVGNVVAPAPPIVITEKSRIKITADHFGNFVPTPKEVLI